MLLGIGTHRVTYSVRESRGSEPEEGDVVAGPDATPTSSFEVPYDYVLENADVVKQRVINHSGVGKIIQDMSAIPGKH